MELGSPQRRLVPVRMCIGNAVSSEVRCLGSQRKGEIHDDALQRKSGFGRDRDARPHEQRRARDRVPVPELRRPQPRHLTTRHPEGLPDEKSGTSQERRPPRPRPKYAIFCEGRGLKLCNETLMKSSVILKAIRPLFIRINNLHI